MEERQAAALSTSLIAQAQVVELALKASKPWGLDGSLQSNWSVLKFLLLPDVMHRPLQISAAQQVTLETTPRWPVHPIVRLSVRGTQGIGTRASWGRNHGYDRHGCNSGPNELGLKRDVCPVLIYHVYSYNTATATFRFVVVFRSKTPKSCGMSHPNYSLVPNYG